MKSLLKSLFVLLLCGMNNGRELQSADVQIGSAVFSPADGSFDISVMLNNNSASALNLATFSLQLSITPTGPGRVEFDPNTQPNTLTNPNYIFLGNSAAGSDPFTPWSVSSTSSGTNNEFTFTDLTSDTLNVSLAAGAVKLLADIRMTPGTGSFTPQPGSQYVISVVPNGTSFYDELLNPIAFTSTSGTLSVPVPEPSTYVMVVIGTGVLIAFRRSRKS